MQPSPLSGMLMFVLGGLFGAVFYLPLKRVKSWAWESGWMVYSVVALLLVPAILGLALTRDFAGTIAAAPRQELLYCLLCGAGWGFGGLTWGLMIRYLGVGLGLAIGCGICSVTGTLVPPMLKGELSGLLQSASGRISLVGVAVSVLGIILMGLAGMGKERDLAEQGQKTEGEFNLTKGLAIALFSGVMSAALSFGLQGGPGLEQIAREAGTSDIWRGLPVLAVCLLGGFLVNGAWCLLLNLKNRTIGDYAKGPVAVNAGWAALAGILWAMQFVAFKIGEPMMGTLGYVGWAMVMASSILFSGVLGILLGEWKGAGKTTKASLATGLLVLLLSALIGGWSASL